MTMKERKALAKTIAIILDKNSDMVARQAILDCKDAIADMIYNDQGLSQWSDYESQWRKDMGVSV